MIDARAFFLLGSGILLGSSPLGSCGGDSGPPSSSREERGPAAPPPARAPAASPALAAQHFAAGRQRIFGSRVKMNYETFDYAALDEGLREMEEASALAPADPEIAYWTGRGWRLRHDDARARAHFERAARLRPDHADTQRQLGSIQLAAGERGLARAAFERALALGSRDPGLFLDYGTLLEQEQDLAGARRSYERAIEADAIQAIPHLRLGGLLFRLGEERAGEREMSRFELLKKVQRKLEFAFADLQRNREDVRALVAVAAAHVEGESFAEALVWIDRALARGPEEPAAHLVRGMALRGLGRAAEAQTHLERTSRLSPGSPEPWRELAQLHAGEGRLELALEAAVAGRNLAPQDPLSHYHVGLVHTLARDPAAAQTAFERALELDPSHVPSLAGLAASLLRQGEEEAALARYEELLRLEPTHGEARIAVRTWRQTP
ncbi:MAG: tetratricopeptide repeat protein [Planctomycetota bacterium]